LVVLAAVVVIQVASGSTDTEASIDGPVLAMEEPPVRPLALIRGTLVLRDGCLVIGDSVAVWPAGTTWDESTESVTFSDEFDAYPVASVGSVWGGGGGAFPVTYEFVDFVGEDGANWINDCVDQTGATAVVFTYPS
jgi:hypothetical protein